MTITHLIVALTFSIFQAPCPPDTVSPADLKQVVGAWEGTLTYMDYSTGKPFGMPAKVLVEEGKHEYQIVLNYSYPKEPHANSKGVLRISKDGMKINGDGVTSRKALENGEVQITTETAGRDNRKKAAIRKTYIFGDHRFVIRKEVKFEDSDEWLRRNEYLFSR